MDEFLGYNEIQIFKPHRRYTNFTIDWGKFAYSVMSFGLCNAPATFHHVMSEVSRNTFVNLWKAFWMTLRSLEMMKTMLFISKKFW